MLVCALCRFTLCVVSNSFRILLLPSFVPFVQINRLTEDLRQNAPLDGNVYIAPEYHQAPHHYLRVSQSACQPAGLFDFSQPAK